MRVLQVIPSLDASYGGPVAILREVVPQLDDMAVTNVFVSTYCKNETLSEIVQNHRAYIEQRYARKGYWAPLKAKKLRELAIECDCVHIRAFFNWPGYVLGRLANDLDIPFVIEPQGTLDAGSLRNNSKLKKMVSSAMVAPLAQKAAGWIATSERERENVEKHRLRTGAAVEVIPPPCGIILNGTPSSGSRTMPVTEARQIGFLGRIHPIKRVDLLIDAASKATSRFTLQIMGEGEIEYEKRIAAQLKTKIGARWIWWRWGSKEEVNKFLRGIDILVLPSRSENFGMVLVEAVACGTPVIASEDVGATEWLVPAGMCRTFPTDDEVALGSIIDKSLEDKVWKDFVKLHGREFVEKHFSPRAVAQKYRDLYARVVGKRESVIATGKL